MYRGVSFKIPQVNSNVLWNILGCIDLNKYFWKCIDTQSEIWTNKTNEAFFSDEYYSGEQFTKRIRSDYYIVFLKLEAYYKIDDFNDIHTYEDFINSDCQILFLINDCEFVEIYIKNHKDMVAIYRNANKMNFENVRYITEKNDGRVKMDVL